jgi:hypothetical protein
VANSLYLDGDRSMLSLVAKAAFDQVLNELLCFSCRRPSHDIGLFLFALSHPQVVLVAVSFFSGTRYDVFDRRTRTREQKKFTHDESWH